MISWYAQQVATRPDYRDKQALKERLRKLKDPRIQLFDNARSRAREYKLPFDIVREDIVIPELCPILNVPMAKGTRYAASLDRIIPELGYIKGNIQVISWKANTMKQDASIQELRNFATWANRLPV